MAVSLYTSRVVLNTLGVVDFGIYNVVGGVVMMFSFLNSAMASSTQRYLTFELGKKNLSGLRKVFSTSIYIHWLVALIILILSETIGLWFFKTKMNIPPERMEAAGWVYQLAILTTMIMVTTVPFTAVIIAYEKMNIFAYISIVEVSLKLLAVILLSHLNYDKLILFAALILLVSLLVRVIYNVYCKKILPNIATTKFEDWSLLKEMANFAGWSLFGNLAFMALTQGLNLLLNVFFNPAINAARAVSVQVQTAVSGFCGNFQVAINPQITKNYASDDRDQMHKLIFSSSKFSFFLLFFFSLPIILEAETILRLWLKIVPPHTVNFLRIIMIISMVDALANPLITAAQATGQIKIYQLIVGGILLLIVPVSYVMLKIVAIPEIVYFVQLTFVIIAQIARIILIKPMIKLSLKAYFNQVFIKVMIVATVSSILPLIIFFHWQDGAIKSVLIFCASLVSITFAIYLFGLNNNEKVFINSKLKLSKMKY